MDWPYSSAAAHVQGQADPLAQSDWLLDRLAGWVCPWGEYLAGSDAPVIGQQLRRHENTGRPLGDKPFLSQLSDRLARNLLPGTPGRPKKGEGN